jgi:hypothetical protein
MLNFIKIAEIALNMKVIIFLLLTLQYFKNLALITAIKVINVEQKNNIQNL